jgi:hypothetical protein
MCAPDPSNYDFSHYGPSPLDTVFTVYASPDRHWSRYALGVVLATPPHSPVSHPLIFHPFFSLPIADLSKTVVPVALELK